eukprot:COSAG05_NODE_188_length_14697_cov_11.861145_5_plen_79_part_00
MDLDLEVSDKKNSQVRVTIGVGCARVLHGLFQELNGPTTRAGGRGNQSLLLPRQAVVANGSAHPLAQLNPQASITAVM